LLTISAESATNQLSNSFLLLDEPETHLHPQAQEYLKDELIKITRNDANNIVFFGLCQEVSAKSATLLLP